MKKKGPMKPMVPKCFDKYLESMESMNTTILLDNNTIRLVYFEFALFVLIRSNSKFQCERESRDIGR